jgi:transcriptional regulator NrdR family protein
MTTVVRRNGTREDFIEERIRRALRKAAIDPGLSANRHSETVESAVRMATERAQAREETTSRDIREGMLSDLDRTAPGVTASWRSFDVNY